MECFLKVFLNILVNLRIEIVERERNREKIVWKITCIVSSSGDDDICEFLGWTAKSAKANFRIKIFYYHLLNLAMAKLIK
jgi:hypothetical protein